jgi:hypothetical protein
MPPEISLQNPAVARTVEESAPSLQFADARWGFLGMQFGHPPVIQILAAAHGIGKVNAPAIPVVDISHRRSYAPLGHYRMRFAQKGFRNNRHLYTGGRSLDRGAKAGTSRSNDQNVVIVRDVLAH